MGRKIRSYAPDEVRKYIPSAYGNRDDKDPVAVWIRNPTEKQRRKIDVVGSDVVLRGDPRGDPDKLEMSVNKEDGLLRQYAAIEECVIKIANYSAELVSEAGTAETVEICDAETLIKYGEREIVTEVANQILHAMAPDADTLGKSGASSASTAPATPLSAGDATSAKRSTSTLPGIATAYEMGSSTSSNMGAIS